MTRRATLQRFAIVSLVATMGYALHASDTGSSDTEQSAPIVDRQGTTPGEFHGADTGGVRFREGLKIIDQVGELRNAAGRIAFYPDGETHSLPLLENLALERVEQDVDQPRRKWTVSGTVTEYKGVNYLLLHHAVLKARVSDSFRRRS